MHALRLLAATATGYALGTIPSADVATLLAKGGRATGGHPDLRRQGSGNPGAANAMAVLGTGWGCGVLGADIVKGALACGVGRRMAGDTGAHIGGTAAVVGHCFPVWNGFRGGKGVAASVGQCLMTFPAYFPVDLAVAGLVAAGPWRRRARLATAVASGAWVAGGVIWARRGWPNAWGPIPTAALPLASAVSSAVILYKFAASGGQR